MSADGVMFDFVQEQGWNVDTQLALALEYIENQKDDSAFADFLQQKADDGGIHTRGECEDCGQVTDLVDGKCAGCEVWDIMDNDDPDE